MLTNPPFDYYEKSPKAMWREDVKTAEELGYPDEVIKRLRSEPDHHTRVRILKDARMAAAEKETDRNIDIYNRCSRK